MNRAPTEQEIEAVLDVLAPWSDMPPGMPGHPIAVRVPVIFLDLGRLGPARPDDQTMHGIAEQIAAAVLNADAPPLHRTTASQGPGEWT